MYDTTNENGNGSNGFRRFKPYRIKLVLGMRGESRPYDFTMMGWESKELMEQLYYLFYKELMSRSVTGMCLWSTKTTQMFEVNNIKTVGQIINSPLDYIQTLKGCGFIVRKEIYDTFQTEIGVLVRQWNPQHYWAKFG